RAEARDGALAEHGAEGPARAGARAAVGLRRRGPDGRRERRRGDDAAWPRPRALPRDDPAVRRRRLHARVHPPDRREPGRVRRLRAARAHAEAVSVGSTELTQERRRRPGRRREHERRPDGAHPGAEAPGAGNMSKGGNESAVPQPEDIYERTKDEGRRRLERPLAEEMSTALAAGFDIVAGIIALALMS